MNIQTGVSVSQDFEDVLDELEELVTQTVAHRKKFQFAVSQFSQFTQCVSRKATLLPLNFSQSEAANQILDITAEYHQLFRSNLLHCWAHSALENSCSQVATDLCSIAAELHEAALKYDTEAAAFFNESSQQWLILHILDLRAIKSSFLQYLKTPKDDDPIYPSMKRRLDSIDAFFEKYSGENAVPIQSVFSPIPVNYQNWRLNYNDLTLEQHIGEGVSAVVYYGHLRIHSPPNSDEPDSNVEVAIKRLKTKKLTGNALNAFQREVTVLASIKYPTLLDFYGATDISPFCIVTKWMPGGSLYSDIHKTHRLDATGLTIAAFDIARGMRFLHQHQIIHRDLKSLNVLIDSTDHIKICDFGFSKILKGKTSTAEDLMTQNIGTPHWMAPELFSGSKTYDSKVDVYAFGIVMWELLTGKLPYQGMDQSQIMAQVMLSDMRPIIPPETPSALAELMRACWDHDPKIRPTFDAIVRQFQTGNIFFPGSDQEAVLSYIKKSIDELDSAAADVNSQLNSTESQSLESFVNVLHRDGIPPSLVESCWEKLQTYEATSADFARGLSLFLRTSKSGTAAKALRKLRNIPKEVIADIVVMIPTGDTAVDDDLVMTACINGGAVQAALHSLTNENIKLALEVLAIDGVDEFHQRQITERCLQVFQMHDPMLIIAAIRCLVKINMAKMIPINQLKTNLGAKSTKLKFASFVAAAKMAQEGVELPTDIIDFFIGQWDKEKLAGTVAVAACTSKNAAEHIIGRLNYGKIPPFELVAKILIEAAKHPQLKEEVKKVALQIDFKKAEKKIQDAIQALISDI